MDLLVILYIISVLVLFVVLLKIERKRLNPISKWDFNEWAATLIVVTLWPLFAVFFCSVELSDRLKGK